ncbi:hypothetical protein E2562_035899 [Oryza meyeriana var. granulata]|uniref:Uncharacterized protein n=1 Tax=Oryza meyeriana var. granulata TaxID=110450 RepID=A0A6G1E816_9ORYZ|nr:hypothetical protein E2562_035899 [Oryza meyeriana var. granulata]
MHGTGLALEEAESSGNEHRGELAGQGVRGSEVWSSIDERDGDPMVSMWMLLDEDAGTWSFHYEASFKAIWDDEGYQH